MEHTETEEIKKTSLARLPWNPVVAVIAVVVIYFAAQFLGGILVSFYPALQHMSRQASAAWLDSSIVAQFFYVLIAEGLTLWFLYLFIRYYKRSLRAVGLVRPKWADIGYIIIGALSYYAVYIVVVSILSHFIPALNTSQPQRLGFTGATGVSSLILTFVSLVILPPFVEEIMFRGFLLGSLAKAMPIVVAVLATSGIFAIAHLEIGSGPLVWIAAVDTFILSLFLCYLRIKTGRLYASMGTHALKNMVAFLLLFVLHVHG